MEVRVLSSAQNPALEHSDRVFLFFTQLSSINYERSETYPRMKEQHPVQEVGHTCLRPFYIESVEWMPLDPAYILRAEEKIHGLLLQAFEKPLGRNESK